MLYKVNNVYLNKVRDIIILPLVSYTRKIWSLTVSDIRV
jgi:hypothetical protein